MQRKVAITQPYFVPWIGLLEMIDWVDVFIFLDDVQYPRKYLANRNRIRSNKKSGWEWITVAIEHTGKLEQKICETPVAQTDEWLPDISNKLEACYGELEFFNKYYSDFVSRLSQPYESIGHLNIALLEWALGVFGIETECIRSSHMNIAGTKEEKLIALIQKMDGDFYLANNGSKPYIKQELFLQKGIGFEFQEFSMPVYQQYDPQLLPPLSFLDLLFLEGPEKGLSIIRQARPAQRTI